MQGHHDVLVATSRARCEASSVVREDVVDWDDLDVDSWCGWLLHGSCWRRRGLRRSYVLSWLCHMPSKRFIGVGAVASRELVSQTGPCLVCSALDGVEPCLLDRISSRGMVVGDECWRVWKIQRSHLTMGGCAWWLEWHGGYWCWWRYCRWSWLWRNVDSP